MKAHESKFYFRGSFIGQLLSWQVWIRLKHSWPFIAAKYDGEDEGEVKMPENSVAWHGWQRGPGPGAAGSRTSLQPSRHWLGRVTYKTPPKNISINIQQYSKVTIHHHKKCHHKMHFSLSLTPTLIPGLFFDANSDVNLRRVLRQIYADPRLTPSTWVC